MKQKPIKKFWNFAASSGNEPPELILYGDISSYSWWGDEVTPQQFNDDLTALGEVSEIIVRINSGGGDVFAATAIYTRLKSHKAKITVIVDGIAASAATVICMAGDVVKIPAAGQFMIHDPSIWCGWSDKNELKKAMNALETTKNSIIAAYALKTGKTNEEISSLMSAETWFTGGEAVDSGFCDEVMFVEEVQLIAADASILSRYKNAPKALFNIQSAPMVGAIKQPPESGTNQTNKGVESMEIKTVDDLKAKEPELIEQIVNSEVDKAVKAERERIQAIENLAVPGFEEVVDKAKFAEPATPEAVAMAIVAAQKVQAQQQGAAYLKGVEVDVANSGMSGVLPEGHEGGGNEKTNPYDTAIDKVLPEKRGEQ